MKRLVDRGLKETAVLWPSVETAFGWVHQAARVLDNPRKTGSYRWHERRITGRKVASPAMVQRGQVRMLASTATRTRRFSAEDLAARDYRAWSQLRAKLDLRREQQKQRTRFRRNPQAFLVQLERQLIQSTLPPWKKTPLIEQELTQLVEGETAC